MRMIPLSGEQMQSLKDAIRQTLIPAITGRRTITEGERDLFALSVRDGGMGIPIPLQTSSQTICNPLVEACGEATEGNLMQEHAKNTQHLIEKNSITTIVQ